MKLLLLRKRFREAPIFSPERYAQRRPAQIEFEIAGSESFPPLLFDF